MDHASSLGQTLNEVNTVEVTESVQYRVGKWLPSDQATLQKWLQKHIDEVDGIMASANCNTSCEDEPDADFTYPLLPVVQKFKEAIERNAEITMFFHQMFSEVPKKYQKTPTGKPQVRNYNHMLILINHILTKAPEFNETGLVGFPINAILDWPMGTVGGYAAFLNGNVNFHLKNILNEWGKYLKSPDSRNVLSKDPRSGWFGEDAMKKYPNFAEEFICDPSKPHYGFTSWDNFFTREFQPGVRPVADPEDNKVIVNACESAPFAIQKDVKSSDKFWVKSQPYNIKFMLANDSLYDQFVGGTVYQAFLNALSYHRWHSPVDGTVVKAYVQEGTYYSEALVFGFNEYLQSPDPSAPNDSQGYLTEVATRAIIFIQADNPYIGLMCFMAVGMAEVSTCEITVYEGQRVKKGQQTGMFHFGGSTHCLIFRRGVQVEFDLGGQKPGIDAHNVPINSKIATVSYC